MDDPDEGEAQMRAIDSSTNQHVSIKKYQEQNIEKFTPKCELEERHVEKTEDNKNEEEERDFEKKIEKESEDFKEDPPPPDFSFASLSKFSIYNILNSRHPIFPRPRVDLPLAVAGPPAATTASPAVPAAAEGKAPDPGRIHASWPFSRRGQPDLAGGFCRGGSALNSSPNKEFLDTPEWDEKASSIKDEHCLPTSPNEQLNDAYDIRSE